MSNRKNDFLIHLSQPMNALLTVQFRSRSCLLQLSGALPQSRLAIPGPKFSNDDCRRVVRKDIGFVSANQKKRLDQQGLSTCHWREKISTYSDKNNGELLGGTRRRSMVQPRHLSACVIFTDGLGIPKITIPVISRNQNGRTRKAADQRVVQIRVPTHISIHFKLRPVLPIVKH